MERHQSDRSPGPATDWRRRWSFVAASPPRRFYRRVRRGGRLRISTATGAEGFRGLQKPCWMVRPNTAAHRPFSGGLADDLLVEAGLKRCTLTESCVSSIFAPDFAGGVLPIGDPSFQHVGSLRLSNQTRYRNPASPEAHFHRR